MEIWLNQHNNATHFTTNAIQEYFRERRESPGPGPGSIQHSLHAWEKRIKHKPPTTEEPLQFPDHWNQDRRGWSGPTGNPGCFLVGPPRKNKTFREDVQSPQAGCEIETAWGAILRLFLRRLLPLLAPWTFNSFPPPEETLKGCDLFMLEQHRAWRYCKIYKRLPLKSLQHTDKRLVESAVYSAFWRSYLGESRPLWDFNSELSLWNWKGNWKACVCVGLFDVSSRSRQTFRAQTHSSVSV